ncbi:succinylglutamate desuccinylase [Weissella oryzae SG25]|uniref:Succinylglutamate desuccinylase n=1 Tax=Weissella oryzae (strain DSM 25784 / JCM 18191 / LMG 30913 / SG25) TaxID=1329250 RepID=A0A069CSK0_WEIOS|nr:hypothetical protein [Weissella oryzae]GAK30765.1 succinylglutamate desuccinylase [Weissella oryzae SG25]
MTLQLSSLPIFTAETTGKLLYAGFNGGFINLSAENVSGNHLLKVLPDSTFKSDDFTFQEPVKLVNPSIVASEIGSGRNNSGVLTGKLVNEASDEKSMWAEEAKGNLKLNFAGQLYDVPVASYIGKTLKFAGVTTGYSQARSSQRQSALRNGDDTASLVEDVIKVTIFDEEKGDYMTVDLPINMRQAVESDFSMGQNVDFINFKVRFYMPETGNYAHIFSADAMTPVTTGSQSAPASKQAPKNDSNKGEQK